MRESHGTQASSYTNLLSVSVHTSDGDRWVEGTVVQNQPRLVLLNGVKVEAPLDGTMLLLMNNEVRQLALKNVDANTIKQAAISAGMRTLRDDGAAKVLLGITTIEEVMMVTAEDKQ